MNRSKGIPENKRIMFGVMIVVDAFFLTGITLISCAPTI
jgi:hypothetical protein